VTGLVFIRNIHTTLVALFFVAFGGLTSSTLCQTSGVVIHGAGYFQIHSILYANFLFSKIMFE
jgi:hypothetical protein